MSDSSTNGSECMMTSLSDLKISDRTKQAAANVASAARESTWSLFPRLRPLVCFSKLHCKRLHFEDSRLPHCLALQLLNISRCSTDFQHPLSCTTSFCTKNGHQQVN